MQQQYGLGGVGANLKRNILHVIKYVFYKLGADQEETAHTLIVMISLASARAEPLPATAAAHEINLD